MSEEDVKIESESKEDEKSQQTSKKRKYRKDKPWDNDTIDHWKPVSVTKEDPLPAPLEESSFATLFPKYREKYIREVWPLVTKTLKDYGVACELDLLEGSMTVKTTRKMWDPYAIMKARDLIKLLARSIPVQQALKIMTDEFHCDIIKIKNMVRNKERFAKRRQRLIGPNGCTLKAIELVTGCYVMVQGNTVSAMGPIKGLKHVRSIVEDCMKNVHPIYTIKQLMIKKELANDPKLKNENWDRFLPKFKKKNVKRKKKPIVQKEYTPFPPAQTPRKVDLLMESGEFFLTDEQKQLKKQEDKRKANLSAKEQKKAQRESEFVAPEEPVVKKQKKADGSSKSTTDASPDDLAALMSKFKKEKNASKQEKNAQDYVLSVPAPSTGENEPAAKKLRSSDAADGKAKNGKRKGRN